MTPEQIQDKIEGLIRKESLTLGEGKVIVPIPNYLDDLPLAHLYVLENERQGKITHNQGKGWKSSLTRENAKNILGQLPRISGEYISLEILNRVLNRYGIGEMSLIDCFKSYVAYYYDASDYRKRLKAFFKFIPFLISIYESHLDEDRYKNPYEFPEHEEWEDDGEEEPINWGERGYEKSKNEIIERLKKIKIIKKTPHAER